jgi:iron(III) transport system permease protein
LSASVTQPVAPGWRGRRTSFAFGLASLRQAIAAGSATAFAAGIFLLLIGLPLGLVLLQAFVPNLFDPVARSITVTLEPFLTALSEKRAILAIMHSLFLATVASLTATLLGGLYAFLLRRTDIPLRGFLVATPWLVFLTPGYLKALAWVLLMSPNGYLAQFGLLPPGLSDAFFSPAGLVFLHTLNLFPLAYFMIDSAMVGLGSEFEDAARTVGASGLAAWLRINLPLLAPAIALALLAIFAEVLADFGMAVTIARTVNFGLLTYGIYAATNDFPVDFALAGSQALVLLLMVVAVLVADRMLRRQRNLRLISGRARPARIYALRGWRWPLVGVGILIALLAVYLPLVAIALRAMCRTLGQGLVTSNFTWRFLNEATTFAHPSSAALLRSLGFATLTAFASVAVAVLLAHRLDHNRPLRRQVVLAVSLASVAIPGIVLGFGYILVWNRLPGFRDLPVQIYGTWPLLVMGYVAAALPYALVIVLSAIGQISPNLVDAARLHGAGAIARLTRIVIPLIAVSLVTATLFVFVRTMFELPMSQLLLPHSGPPSPALIVRLFGNDDDGIASALSLVTMLATSIVAGSGWLIARRFSHSIGKRTRLDHMVGLSGHR